MATAARDLCVWSDRLAAFERPSGQFCAGASCSTKETKALARVLTTLAVLFAFHAVHKVSTYVDVGRCSSPAHRERQALDHFKQPCAQYLCCRDKKCALFELLCCQRDLRPLPVENQTHVGRVSISPRWSITSSFHVVLVVETRAVAKHDITVLPLACR